MNLFELCGGTETAPAYQALEAQNGLRQYAFISSLIEASLSTGKVFLSQSVIKALNFHAIACLHSNAGEYRPCPVTVGNYEPPAAYRLQSLMDDFVNSVNRQWETTDPVTLCALVLWRLNLIHPFINGNGRTARATAYFVLCLKLGGHLRGQTMLPELLRQPANRPRHTSPSLVFIPTWCT
jgi:prophage maintenance system killer protein